MSGSSFSGTGSGQPPFLDQRDLAGSSSSHSGGRFERTDDANFSGTHSCPDSHCVDVQQPTGREARRSVGKTKLTASDHSEKGDDRPRPSDHPGSAPAARPTSAKRNSAAPRISACHSAPVALAGDSMQIPWERCDVPKVAPAYNRESRSHSCRAEVAESSESEAEAIAVRQSKWATYGMPLVQSSKKPKNEDAELTVVEAVVYRSRTEGSDQHHLNNYLNISDLFEAASAQLERAGNTERPWAASEFGDDEAQAQSLEQKVAAWDPCQEDSYALSPPGELELFELDMFDPGALDDRIPPKIKKLLPVKAADSSMYEDLQLVHRIARKVSYVLSAMRTGNHRRCYDPES
ncbi:hypothetical protein HPB52_024236 [Rhipicephalus sanguineus]|uniref:Uncharacterized protein n=1 Tax=Rhipicephalus sanguineus TaxID=34632 RepID=A0A9D4SN73_RHISA|nr:hypothetical protein HPB52_024236 [Rhipicephalus sanguineus]